MTHHALPTPATRRLLLTALCGLAACSGKSDSADGFTEPSCDYPANVAEPMAVGSALAPYRWPIALHRDGREAPLDLAHVPCGSDPNIDWSPFDVLLFVSIPAW